MNVNVTLDADSPLERALAILEAIATSDRSLTVADLCDQLHLPKPTAHRTCARLVKLEIIQRSIGQKGFSVGPKLSQLAINVLLRSEAKGPRRAILRSVVEQVGETCTLSMLDGDEIILLDRVESTSPLRVQLYAGSRVPLHCSSAGKLFLAMLPPVKRQALITSAPLKKFTANTITDPKVLEQELIAIKEARLGRDNEEYLTGLVGIAVPVFDQKGRTCAAISLNAPRARMGLSEMAGYINSLLSAAEALSKTLPAKPPNKRL